MGIQEQRGAERFAVNGDAVCSFASPVLEDFGPVKIKNISMLGVGLVTREAMPVGMLMAVRLVNPTKKFSKMVLMRVAHVTAQPGGAYVIGGSLDTPLTYDELCAMVM
jgi:hypothetical protein